MTGRARPVVQAFTGDGPILVAILDVLGDLHDLLDARLQDPASANSEGPVRISEPAPAGPPPKAVPVAEPAPETKPEVDDEEPTEVAEPAPDVPSLPAPPPRAGRGSSRPAWAAWAGLAGVEVTDDMNRDDIIAACELAEVIEGR